MGKFAPKIIFLKIVPYDQKTITEQTIIPKTTHFERKKA